MAIQVPITPSEADEVPRETSISRAFPVLLNSVHEFIVAERDLEDVGHAQDPAYAAWLRDAEIAQESLAECLHNFQSLPTEIREDRPLKRMAWLIDGMLGHEEPGGARRLHFEMLVVFFTDLQVSGIGATAMQRNSFLIQARHLVTAMAQLPLFDGAPEVAEETASELATLASAF